MMHWADYPWGWGMGFGWLFMVFFWVLIISGIVYLVRVIAGREKKGPEEETPLDILKRRYAKGEITKDEYDRIKEDLLRH
ncbi:MAG: SHOCT domain-containing protein [Nitrospirae bacterium]|nr:SHOCT domain-containing protein [Nitrospirota bacterium]